jgi:hypothetical protein
MVDGPRPALALIDGLAAGGDLDMRWLIFSRTGILIVRWLNDL